MELKGRLKLISNKIPICNILCDIGTDHAYIPIFLVKDKRCKRAVACDIRMKPLVAARRNIRAYGLEEHIDTRLGDGLEPLGENEADVIIIAGVGGNMIERILKNGFKKALNADSLVLQPMNDIDMVRRWLYQNGFDIYDEGLIDEGEKIYNVICTRWTGEAKELDPVYYYIGRKLVENRDPLLERYLSKKIRQLEKIIIDMENVEEEHKEKRRGYMDLLDGFKRLREI